MKTHHTASSTTDCKDQPLLFQDLGARRVVADFTGGTLSTDGGALLLREVNHRLGVARALAQCFDDQRDARFVDHRLAELLAQRLAGLALGYEDLNDHEQLRRDPLLAVACDKTDPLGQDRVFPDNRGAALASSGNRKRRESFASGESRRPRTNPDLYGSWIWRPPAGFLRSSAGGSAHLRTNAAYEQSGVFVPSPMLSPFAAAG